MILVFHCVILTSHLDAPSSRMEDIRINLITPTVSTGIAYE